MKESKASKTNLVVISIICATVVAVSAIAAFVYINQQTLAQQKSLKEAEINAENERAEKQREFESEESRRERMSCIVSGAC